MPEPSQPRLSHIAASGQAVMVDVSDKQPVRRGTRASAFVELSAEVVAALHANPKGNPLEAARFAGIQAAKRTADLIPMCHPLALTHVDVQAEIVTGGVRITAIAAAVGPTGVEMEALTATAGQAGGNSEGQGRHRKAGHSDRIGPHCADRGQPPQRIQIIRWEPRLSAPSNRFSNRYSMKTIEASHSGRKTRKRQNLPRAVEEAWRGARTCKGL